MKSSFHTVKSSKKFDQPKKKSKLSSVKDKAVVEVNLLLILKK